MMVNFLSDNPNSVQTLHFLWIWWTFYGFYRSENYNSRQKLHLISMILIFDVFLSCTFIIQLFYVSGLKELFLSLPMCTSVMGTFLKYLLILKYRLKFIQLEDYFQHLDTRISSIHQATVVRESIKLGQRFTLAVGIYFGVLVLNTAINAALTNREQLPFNMWIPYNFHNPAWRYWLTFLFEYIFVQIEVLQAAINDACGSVYLIMTNAHLEAFLDRVGNIGWDSSKTQEENCSELINCIEDHRVLMRIFGVLQESNSQIMLIQFILTAVVLSMEAVIFLIYPLNLTECLVLFAVFFAIIVQIFPCCYYSNQFMVLTDQTVMAVYSSNFPDQSLKFKRTMLIFMQMTQKSRVMVAAKIIPVTLQTFVSIMKMTYSLVSLALQFR